MSALLEVEDLESLIGDDSPACTFEDAKGVPEGVCGRPSVARVRVQDACGCLSVDFVCQQCLDDLENNDVECSVHLEPVSEWAII